MQARGHSPVNAGGTVVERSDLVVIITRLTSHGSMYAAKRLSRLHGRTAVVVRTCGVARLQLLLAQFNDSGLAQVA